MQVAGGPNPNVVDQYLQIYEAFDTMREDTDALAATRAALLEACTPGTGDLATLNAEVARDLTRIEERRRYVVGSVIGQTALDALSIQAASLAYVTGYESTEGQQHAAWRVSTYNAILEQAWYLRAVPPRGLREVSSNDPGRVVQPGVRIYGHADPDTGKTWVSLTDPRAVEHTDPVRVDDKVLAEYEVVSSSVNDAGETVAVIRPEGMPERTVVFPADSLVWRINPAGRLELFIPANRSSIGETEVDSLARLLDSLNGVMRLVVQVTGANLPNIATTFNDPTGNPYPIPVAKKN
jgi:hypothetical protein